MSTTSKQIKTEAASTTKQQSKTAARPKRQPKAAPQLSERARKLALKAFQMTYDAHHGKRA